MNRIDYFDILQNLNKWYQNNISQYQSHYPIEYQSLLTNYPNFKMIEDPDFTMISEWPMIIFKFNAVTQEFIIASAGYCLLKERTILHNDIVILEFCYNQCSFPNYPKFSLFNWVMKIIGMNFRLLVPRFNILF